ncbi:MAG: PEP-CTERM sorting domain-containing protein [Halioglobus sp.]|nr:PEP-CTERM sorting domain-containing protein [Halioglobus sp.]
MKFGRGWVIGIGALLLAGTAQAGLIVKSIDIAMVNTDFDSRAIPGLVPDELAFAFSLSNFMSAWNDSDKRVCAKELQDFDAVNSRLACGGSGRDLGTLFVISGSSSSGPTELELGVDWGRGGFTMLATAGGAPLVERYDSDLWWGGNWSHGDVLDIIIPKTAHFLLVGLGFEGCCDGLAAARWRSVGGDLQSVGGPGQWQSLAVASVPEPGVPGLLVLGLVAAAVARRECRSAAARQT